MVTKHATEGGSYGQSLRLRIRLAPSISLVVIFSLAFFYAFGYAIFDPEGTRLLGSRDMWRFHGPNQYFLDHSLGQAQLPLWNPYVYCGMPFYADPQAMVCYPPNIVRGLLARGQTPFSTHVSLAAMVGFHAILLGIATFLVARDHGLTWLSSVVAGVTLLLSTPCAVAAFNHINFVFFLAWVPVICLTIRRAALTRSLGGRAYWAVACGTAYGVQILVGFPQLQVAATLAYAVFYGCERVSAVMQRHDGGRSGLESLRGSLFSDATFASIALCVGSLVAASMLIPATELGGLSLRSEWGQADSTPSKVETGISLIEHARWTWLISDGSVIASLRVAAQILSFPISISVGSLVLCIFAIQHRRRMDLIVFVAMFYVLLDLSLGAPLPLARLIALFVPFAQGASRYSSILAVFPLSLLVGFGFDAVTKLTHHSRPSLLRFAFHSLASVMLLVLLARCDQANVTVKYMAIGLPLAITVWAMVSPCLNSSRVMRAVLFLLVLADIAIFNVDVLPNFMSGKTCSVERQVLRQRASTALANRRSLGVAPNSNMYELRPIVNGYNPLVLASVNSIVAAPGRESHYSRWLPADSAAQNPYAFTFLKRPFWLVRRYVRGSLPGKSRPFPPTDVVFLSTGASEHVPETEVEDVPVSYVSERSASVVQWSCSRDLEAVVKRTDPSDGNTRITFPTLNVGKSDLHGAVRLTYTSDRPSLATIAMDAPDNKRQPIMGPFSLPAAPRQERSVQWPLPDIDALDLTIQVFLRGSGASMTLKKVEILRDYLDEDQCIEVMSWSANGVEVVLSGLPDQRILVFTDAFYDGWEAFIDGVPAPIYRANDAFKAIVVGAGTHHVKFVFKPDLFIFGAMTSATALLLCVLIMVFGSKVAAIPIGPPIGRGPT